MYLNIWCPQISDIFITMSIDFYKQILAHKYISMYADKYTDIFSDSWTKMSADRPQTESIEDI